MNRDDLLRMAVEAKLYDEVEDCKNCNLRIPSVDALERYTFMFYQAAREEMIKQGWKHPDTE